MSNERKNIKEELSQLGCFQLERLHDHIPVQSIDNKYFDENLFSIKEKGLLFPFSKTPYEITPDDYFQKTNIVFWSRLEEEDKPKEENSIAPLSEYGKIAMPYTVPKNYFKDKHIMFLEEEEEIIKEKKHTKVISMFREMNKYVAAAVILVVFSIGSNFLLRLKQMHKTYNMLQQMDIHNELAEVPTSEIFQYLDKESNKTIIHFANPSLYNNPLKVISPKNRPINHKLEKDVTPEDIAHYLNEENPIY